MAGSNKKVKQKQNPRGNIIKQGGNPNGFYSLSPAWKFSNGDKEMWSLYSSNVTGDFLLKEFLPYLQELELQTWSDILIRDKKKNHSIEPDRLNKAASDRFKKLKIEAEAVISLRITSTHRVYGYMVGAVFNVLWLDLDHGDNEMCVCRSNKKHT